MKRTPPKLLRQTCLACRQSKVKCDRASPACGRCVRLGIACIDSAPSRRGRGRSVGKKTAALQQLSGSALDSVKSGPDHTTRDIQDTATRRRRLDRACARVAPRRIGARLFDALRAGLAHGVPGKTQALGRLRRAHRERCLLRGAKRVLRLPRAAPAWKSLLAALCGTSTGDAATLAGAPAAAAGQRQRRRPAGGQAGARGPIPGAPARAVSTDTRADDAAAQAAEALASSFPAALPNAAKALLQRRTCPYATRRENSVWFSSVRRRCDQLRRLGGLRSPDL